MWAAILLVAVVGVVRPDWAAGAWDWVKSSPSVQDIMRDTAGDWDRKQNRNRTPPSQ